MDQDFVALVENPEYGFERDYEAAAVFAAVVAVVAAAVVGAVPESVLAVGQLQSALRIHSVEVEVVVYIEGRLKLVPGVFAEADQYSYSQKMNTWILHQLEETEFVVEFGPGVEDEDLSAEQVEVVHKDYNLVLLEVHTEPLPVVRDKPHTHVVELHKVGLSMVEDLVSGQQGLDNPHSVGDNLDNPAQNLHHR